MGDAMIFTCPSGHRTFLGEPTGPRALPIVGAGELRHCLTCNAERRFEWKPEPPSPYPELDGLIMPTVTVSREELARRYPQGEPPGYAFKITEAQDAALEREEAKRAEKPEMKAWGDTDKMSDELDQEARAKNRTASEGIRLNPRS